MRNQKILLTGATGYIASHTWLALLESGFDVVGVDNFANSSPEVLNRLQRLSGQAPVFEKADVGDAAALDAVFAAHKPAAVVHFAAFKAVGESTTMPLAYYRNNIGGLINTCETMRRHGCSRMVFSSSATVYGAPAPTDLPLREDAALSAVNPYGATKLMGETILRDLGAAEPDWQTACLRYFNPVGAHESGLIGEDPRGIPNNLMPYVAQVAVGRRAELQVFGDDYDTPDGTGVRDYIHVMDLAEGHVAALRFLLNGRESITANLGTGRGYSVLDLVRAYSAASGRPIPYRIAPRRTGDAAACWADASLANEKLGWSARHDLVRMCEDSWRWQSMNPQGFEKS
ncbi:UDP-glucose 4-epimerase GalE [Roseateles sp. DAIF2]|uniref:UDP-glucose 4-epimerase GalE n=1 Tax=Roseateles sp. DAIF2 TaxID=2714952 RepID=UPI0018A2E455|nr:UDP-glucose 4-epimerase GalE [Roseateles sp. DAIF2]QPF75085.1 UDP-glucose 4-epimerase GalE [Roseateles sp. DAIF2]